MEINIIATQEAHPAQEKINTRGDISCWALPNHIPDDVVISAACRKLAIQQDGHRLSAPCNGMVSLCYNPRTRTGRYSRRLAVACTLMIPGYKYVGESAGGRGYWAWQRQK